MEDRVISKSLQPVAVFLLLTSCIVVALPGASAIAKSQRGTVRKTRSQEKTAQAAAQARYEVGKGLNLNLLQCTGEINFPAAGISADALEISGGNVSLSSGGTLVKRGEVIAYAQSKYFLDSNVAFIFDRSDKPLESPEWKPPVIISLNLVQDRKNRRRLALTSIPIGDSPVIRIALACGSADASLR